VIRNLATVAAMIAVVVAANAAGAEPLTEEQDLANYHSCIIGGRQTAPTLPATSLERYCACQRRELAQRFTRDSLREWEERDRTSQGTPQDRALIQEIVRVCGAEMRR
jgi:hypothetical protein